MKDYVIPGCANVIKEGTPVILPLGPLHVNPDYFPKPKEFIPERFEPNSGMVDERAYFPFGGGPRSCIAWKMGWMVSKVSIMKILYKYNLELLTKGSIVIDPQTLTGLPKDPIHIRLSLKQ